MITELHYILHIYMDVGMYHLGGEVGGSPLAIMSVYKTVFCFYFTKLAFHFVSDS